MENNNLRYIFGLHAVVGSLESQNIRVNKLFLYAHLNNKATTKIKFLAEKNNISINVIQDIHYLDELSEGGVHQGVVALVSFKQQYYSIKTLKDKKFVLILDHLQDPHNLGAILRNADQFGVEAVIIPKNRSVEITPTVIKTSCGAALFVPVVRESSLLTVVQQLKDYGFWIYSTSSHDGESVYQTQFSDKTAVILGNEHKGVSEQLIKKSDFQICIPSSPKRYVDSLNVSSASAITLSQIYQQLFL